MQPQSRPLRPPPNEHGVGLLRRPKYQHHDLQQSSNRHTKDLKQESEYLVLIQESEPVKIAAPAAVTYLATVNQEPQTTIYGLTEGVVPWHKVALKVHSLKLLWFFTWLKFSSATKFLFH